MASNRKDNTIIKSETKDSKTLLINVFKNCLNILRDNEGLTGEKALRTMSYLLILKLIEAHLDKEIDIDNFEFDFSHIEDDMVENHKNKLLKIVRFSNLANEKEDNIPVNMKYLWDDILSKHPSTKNIFLNGKGFDIRHKSSYKKLIDKLNSVDLSKTDYDILGNAYEEVIQDIMTGKVLGQFFTQPLIKKMMVKLINPQIHSDGKIDTCGDPAMGTGGFLISYLQCILEQAKNKKIKPNWDFIKNEGIYGKELEPDTYQLAVSNMLISSGHMFEKLEQGDSIRDPITRKFDNILANPPFGIKGLKYDDFQSTLKSVYTPIKTDNAVSLFIQAIIYMLKINGKCAVVLPDGQDLFSKTNKTLVAIREYLMKTCDLKEIIYLPAGIFTYTTIKTCVFYFVKKREGTDVLETKIKVSKTKKETGRDYKFSKTHQTTKVKFYDYNPNEDVKNLLVEVPIEKIVSNSYSLNYAEYMKDENEEEKQYEEGVVIKTLGEVCEIEKNLKKYDTSYGKSKGKYKFHTGGERTDLYVDECDIKEMYIIQNRTNGSGKCNLYLDKNFSLAKQTIAYRALNKDENTTKYIYYYLLFNKGILEKGFVGANHKNISKEYISNIKIPIPSLERQQEIVKYLDFIYEKANKTSITKIEELKQLNEFCLSNQKIFGKNVVKKLNDITTYKSGKRLPLGHLLQDNKTPHPYIRITDIYNNSISLDNIKYITQETKNIINKYIITTDDIYITIAGTTGLVGIIPDELNGANLTENAVRINIVNKNEILQKYLVYEIHYNQQKELKTKTIGAAIPKLSIERLMTLQISIPTLERQKEIVEYCDLNNKLIEDLEKDIERNKLLATKYLDLIFNSNPEIKTIIESKQIDNDEIETDETVIDSNESKKITKDKKKSKKSKKTKEIDDELELTDD